MIDLNSTRQLVDRMQNIMASKKGMPVNTQEEIERSAISISFSLEEIVLQIKRCVTWIESGRFIEASALSEDCGNLVLVSDILNSKNALPQWITYCQSESLPEPPQINPEDIQTINNGSVWEGKIKQLSNAWIESNVLHEDTLTKWRYIHTLSEHDSHNQIWELQEKQIAPDVLPLLIINFDKAAKSIDISKMKSTLHSLTKLPHSKDRVSEEKRMRNEIRSTNGLISSREMLVLSEKLALAEANADLVTQRSLVKRWDELVSNGGNCDEKLNQIDQVKRNLEEEDKEQEKESNIRGLISQLGRMIDEKRDVHEIETLYYRLDNLACGNIPNGLKEIVRERIKEFKSLRRRKTKTVIFVTAAVLIISISYLGLNFFQQYQENKIIALVEKGNRCLVNYDTVCFESWEKEIKIAGFQNTPRVAEVIAKYDESKKQKTRIETNAERQFKTARRLIDSDRPSGSSLTANISQLQDLSKSTINHISEQANIILGELEEKKFAMIESDTKALEQALKISQTNETKILDPSSKGNTRLNPVKWRETAIEIQEIIKPLQSSLANNYFAQKRTTNLVSTKIDRLQKEIIRRNKRASDIDECIVALSNLNNKPVDEKDWADKVNNLNNYKSVVFQLGGEINLSEINFIAKASLAAQHWRESTRPAVKLQWVDNPWIDNMRDDESIIKTKSLIELHLQQYPHTPYKEYIVSMSAILSEQIEINVDNILREIHLFTDVYRVDLLDKRYYYAKGVMGSPELHAIEEDDDLQMNPADLSKPNLITDSPVISSELSKLSESLLAHTQKQTALGKPKSRELLLYLLSAIDICKQERLNDPILSLAACTRFVNIALQNFDDTLKNLAPELFESFQKWSWNNQVNDILSDWPKEPRSTNEYRKKQHCNDASKLLSSFAVNSKVLKDNINNQWSYLTSSLKTVIIQGVLKSPNKSGKREIIQDADPVALIFVKTTNGWKFETLINNHDGTGTPNGVPTNANTPIFIRNPQ